jgi:Domain of unknown function (DUF222)
MYSSSREEIVETFDALEADLNRALGLSFDALTTPEQLALLERCERFRRCLPAVEHPLINQVSGHADATELGGKLPAALANRLRITRGEASRRIHEAADLGERKAITGEPLPARLEATAAAQRAGDIGAAHVAVIRGFMHRLPDFVDVETGQKAEAQLARLGSEHRPDELAKLADKLTDFLNPDGNFTDDDRARRRGITIGKQDIDAMSPISGYLTPEARATLDAVFAKLAAPGMCNPADDTPCVQGSPSEQAVSNDTRSCAQRNHDALNAAGRALLASGELGQHNGLPASIIVTTTLSDLEAAAGNALTGGGTLLPMSDVIRMARHAHHYLAIFDNGRALALHHTKRLASPAQRIMLYANKGAGYALPMGQQVRQAIGAVSSSAVGPGAPVRRVVSRCTGRATPSCRPPPDVPLAPPAFALSGSALRDGDTVDLDVEGARPLRHAEEDAGRRVLREKALVDLVESLEAVGRDAHHVALQHMVEVRAGGLERLLHLGEDELDLVFERRVREDFPGVGVERRHARDEHHVAGPGAGRHRRAPLLEIAVDGFDPDDFPFHAFAPGPFGVSLRPQPPTRRHGPSIEFIPQRHWCLTQSEPSRLAGGRSLLQPFE